MSLWIAAASLLIVATIVAYNGLVRSRERTREAWSGIDVQLTRRAELVPVLVEVVRGYASHERQTLEEIAIARAELLAASGPARLAGANDKLSAGIAEVLAVVERYPELEAVDAFVKLQHELTELEGKLAYARQFYNRNALDFNTRIRRIPTVVLARFMRLEAFEFFEAGPEDRETLIRFGSLQEPGS